MWKANPKSTIAPKVHHLNFGMICFLFRYPIDARYIKLIVEIYSAAPEAAGRNFPFSSLSTELLGFRLDLALPLCVGHLRASFGKSEDFCQCSVGVL